MRLITTIGLMFALGALAVAGHGSRRSPEKCWLIVNGVNLGIVNTFRGPDPGSHEITMQVSPGMGMGMYDWMKAAFNGDRRTGVLVAADYNFKALRKVEFRDALLTEFTIPVCDAGSKDAAFLTVKLRPISVNIPPAGGSVTRPLDGTTAKSWSPSNFRFNIDGMDCHFISKIDFPNLMAKSGTVRAAAPSWQPSKGWPAKWELGEYDAWRRTFQPKSGELRLLDDRGGTLMTIGFRMVRLIRANPSNNGRSLSMELMFDGFMMK